MYLYEGLGALVRAVWQWVTAVINGEISLRPGWSFDAGTTVLGLVLGFAVIVAILMHEAAAQRREKLAATL